MLDYGFICKNTKLSKHAPPPSKKMLNWEQNILYALYVLIRLLKKKICSSPFTKELKHPVDIDREEKIVLLP